MTTPTMSPARPGVPSEDTWLASAACHGRGIDLFHPTGPDGRDLLTHERHVIPAARVCAGCPVRAECLADARAQRDYYGVRAGLTGSERRRLRQSCRICGLASPAIVCRVCRLRTKETPPATPPAKEDFPMHADTDVEFVDELPPPALTRTGRHARIAAALRHRPRTWAAAATFESRSSAHALASDMRRGLRRRAYTPAGAFEAEVRRADGPGPVDGGWTVYARYVGQAACTKERT